MVCGEPKILSYLPLVKMMKGVSDGVLVAHHKNFDYAITIQVCGSTCFRVPSCLSSQEKFNWLVSSFGSFVAKMTSVILVILDLSSFNLFVTLVIRGFNAPLLRFLRVVVLLDDVIVVFHWGVCCLFFSAIYNEGFAIKVLDVEALHEWLVLDDIDSVLELRNFVVIHGGPRVVERSTPLRNAHLFPFRLCPPPRMRTD